MEQTKQFKIDILGNELKRKCLCKVCNKEVDTDKEISRNEIVYHCPYCGSEGMVADYETFYKED